MTKWWKTHPMARWFYPVWILLTTVVFAFGLATDKGLFWGYMCLLVLVCFALRPRSAFFDLTLEKSPWVKKLFTLLVALVTVAACILPMADLPLWNGEIPGHRNQYELMAENILEGRLDFAYGDEDALLALENPYDPEERKATGVQYHWDHAYYDGHYYMYFGVVPVFLAFLPYRVLTGQPLTTYHATQLFTALAVLGIFALFALLQKRFFKKLPYGVYLLLSAAFSVMSVWYAAAEPALYCTAITAALALETWSLYFFIRAVYVEKKENRQILFAGIGALLGALVFGCRPPIALANMVVLPLLAVFLQQHKITWKLLGKLILAALPYAVVAVALMAYNNARFDSPFEFGQKYQLTVADQTQYSVTLNGDALLRIWNESVSYFFSTGSIKKAFPYIRTISVFFNFPILFVWVGMCKFAVLKNMRYAKVLPFVLGLLLAVAVITAMDILWTPYMLERYRMDIYFLLGIGCYLVIGFWYNAGVPRQRPVFVSAVAVLSVLTLVSAFLLYVQTVGNYYPSQVTEIAEILHLN